MSTVRKVPMRKCVGCGEMKNKKELIRVLKTRRERFCWMPAAEKNGRGAYLCPSSDCLRKAERSRGLERSLGVRIPPEIYEKLRKEMDQLGE